MTGWLSNIGPALALGMAFSVPAAVAFLTHFAWCRLVGAMAARRATDAPPDAHEPSELTDLSDLAVIVFACGEAPAILDRTLAAARALIERGAVVTLLNNAPTESEDAAYLAIAAARGVGYARHPYLGSKARVFTRALATSSRPLLMPLDADEAPVPAAIGRMVARLRSEPDDVAFIQGFNRGSVWRWWHLAEAARQNAYREVVCPARDGVGRVHFLGTTAVLRTSVLRAHGIPDWSVTEDNALSAMLHLAGYRSRYHGEPCSHGLGCADFPAYFRQQRRWSHGNLTVLFEVARRALHTPRAAPAALWLNYLLCGLFFPATLAWSLGMALTVLSALSGPVTPGHFAGHALGFGLVVALLPGPRRVRGAAWLVVGNLLATPAYAAGLARAVHGRVRTFDVTVKDHRDVVVAAAAQGAPFAAAASAISSTGSDQSLHQRDHHSSVITR